VAAIHKAAEAPPSDYVHHQGWVIIAFKNALWQLLHSTNFKNGTVYQAQWEAALTMSANYAARRDLIHFLDVLQKSHE